MSGKPYFTKSAGNIAMKKYGKGVMCTDRGKRYDAKELWKGQCGGQISLPDYLARGKTLDGQITHHLRDRALKDKDNQRMLNGLGTHHDRGNLLRFLGNPSVEPTNNRAERALRGAVIARKVSHCSKNQRGADARAAFMSVIKALRKRGAGY